MTHRRFATRAGGALVVCLLALPASALGASQVTGDGDIVVNGDDAANHIVLTEEPGFLVIAEEGADVADGSPDCADHPDDATKVRCAFNVVNSVTVDGNDGADVLDDDQDTESVVLFGDLGDDVLNSGADGPGSTLAGGPGNDTLNARNGAINATDGGGEGDDTYNGAPALRDVFSGDPGADTYHGGEPPASNDPYCNLDPEICGEPRDEIVYGGVAGVVVTLNGVADDGAGEADNVMADVENVVGSDGNDRIDAAGAPGRHAFEGGPGDDVLIGGPGDDRLELGPGADTGEGASGNDLIFDGDFDPAGAGADRLAGGPDDDSLHGARGADDLSGGDGYDYTSMARDGPDGLPLDIEITLDDVANDGVKGTGEGDNFRSDLEYVVTGDGNDRLIGSANADTLDSGFGSDVVDGAAGVDTIFAGNGVDSVVSRDGGFDLVNCGDGADPEVPADASDRLDNCELRADAPVPPPADTTKPVARILSKATVAGETFRRNKGLKVVFTSDEDVVVQGGATASRARIAKVGDIVLGEGRLGLGKGKRTIRIRFGKRYVAAIARKLRRKSYKVTVRLTALDKAGNGVALRKAIRIKKLKRSRRR